MDVGNDVRRGVKETGRGSEVCFIGLVSPSVFNFFGFRRQLPQKLYTSHVIT